MELISGETHIFESWDEIQAFWFRSNQMGHLKRVHVLDKPKTKQTKAKGF